MVVIVFLENNSRIHITHKKSCLYGLFGSPDSFETIHKKFTSTL